MCMTEWASPAGDNIAFMGRFGTPSFATSIDCCLEKMDTWIGARSVDVVIPVVPTHDGKIGIGKDMLIGVKRDEGDVTL